MKTHSDIVWETIHSRSGAALSTVAASWCRSALKHGLDPAQSGHSDRLGERELASAREAHETLLRVASPVLDNLHLLVGRTGCAVILTDALGLVLERRAPAGDARLFDESGLSPGTNWSEGAEGTNGIGTCLAEDRPVTIHRGQHFRSRNSSMSCMDAPVHDEQGRLLGAIDVSSCRYDHDEAVALMVAAIVNDAARRIERAYFLEAFRDARVICGAEEPSSGPAMIAVDRDDLIIGATRAARRIYGLTEASFATPRPAADVLAGSQEEGFNDADRAVLKRALARNGGNVAAAARSLGIGRATFYRRMARAGLESR